MVNRIFVSFPISDITISKKQLLYWASSYGVCCFLDNNQYAFHEHRYECLLAAGAEKEVSAPAGTAFLQLAQFCKESQDWIFGHLSYDLKNELEAVQSGHPDGIKFPDLFMFVPRVIVMLNDREMLVSSKHIPPALIFEQVSATAIPSIPAYNTAINLESRFRKEEYLEAVRQLQLHIRKGDCYEITFCQEFFATGVETDPLSMYLSLNQLSPNPFAAFYKVHDRYLCCASPERYLKKQGSRLVSQPIKGTSARNLESSGKDEEIRRALYLNSKERAENVMVVDLVRNDLSKVCAEGTVRVDELYGIYSFPQVHQMISTISGQMKEELPLLEAIKATFPMGSMTGAPKKRVMQLIEQYERSKRGIFSGSVGYITPQGDFDFNVVIRSIAYNRAQQYLSYHVGSAITFYSDALQEYEECLLKARAIRETLGR